MSYKPQDVFLGVIDLFVIILPGSLLVFGCLRVLYGYPEQQLPWVWGGLAAATAFVITAYLLGHLTSLLGSKFEDKWWDDRFDPGQDPSHLRPIVEEGLERRYGLPVKASPELVRRWAFKAVRITDGVATVALDRKDADRRFFRNSLVVLAILALLFLERLLWVEGIAAWAEAASLALLGWACWRRYADQSEKFTREVFEYFVIVFPQGRATLASKEDA